MRTLQRLRVVAMLALVAGLSLVGGARAFAQDGSPTLTVHGAECPHGVGPDIFEVCHHDVQVDSAVLPNGDGTVTFTIDPGFLSNYLGAYVYCSEQNSGTVLYDGSYADSPGGIVFPVSNGDDVICDVYLITPAVEGDDGSGSADTGAADTSDSRTAGTTALPSTGTGSAPADRGLTSLLGTFAIGLAALGLYTRRAPR
jgi:hypothetical protein